MWLLSVKSIFIFLHSSSLLNQYGDSPLTLSRKSDPPRSFGDRARLTLTEKNYTCLPEYDLVGMILKICPEIIFMRHFFSNIKRYNIILVTEILRKLLNQSPCIYAEQKTKVRHQFNRNNSLVLYSCLIWLRNSMQHCKQIIPWTKLRQEGYVSPVKWMHGHVNVHVHSKRVKNLIKILTMTGIKAIQKYVCQPGKVKQTP